MIAVDTNVLVYAHREETRWHDLASARLAELAEGQPLWGLPVFCLGEFLRVVTHPRVFDPPSTLEQAGGFLEALAASPSLRILTPGPRFLALLAETTREGQTTGNLVFDAVIAALLLESGVRELLTQDRDFARFRSLAPVHLS